MRTALPRAPWDPETLHFLGNVTDQDVPSVVDALHSVPRDAVPANTAGRAKVFFQSVLDVGVSGLDALAKDVSHATRSWGEPPQERFAGHLTLARSRNRRVLRTVESDLPPLDWHVKDFTLTRSVLKSNGASYEWIASFPLG